MALDPLNPPIWLRKLHVSAQQISPDDYASTPEEGLSRGCELSDAMLQFSAACAAALGSRPLPPRDPFENPFRQKDGPTLSSPMEQRDNCATD